MQNKIINIYMAADHAGYELKENIKLFLEHFKSDNNLTYNIIDYGAKELEPEDNYTDIMHKLGYDLSLKLKQGENDIAFVFGGSGQGENILMNRFGSVRSIVYYGVDLDIIRLGREHNDANCISFGARFINEEDAKSAILVFLNTEFEGGRHLKRIADLEINFTDSK